MNDILYYNIYISYSYFLWGEYKLSNEFIRLIKKISIDLISENRFIPLKNNENFNTLKTKNTVMIPNTLNHETVFFPHLMKKRKSHKKRNYYLDLAKFV